ncbi:MAG: mercuric transporter MerT family protein, partial [Vicinamibacteria bacterium]
GMRSSGTTKLLNAGAVGSALAASVCCLGPLVLALLGLGGGALLLKFAPYRPYLLVASLLCLGAAFFLTYRRPLERECEPDAACASPSRGKGQKTALWIVTVIVALAALFPYFSGSIF